MCRTRSTTACVVAGTVDTVRDYYVEQARKGLANYFMVMLPFGRMTAEQTETTLAAFIDEIIPAVREVEMSLVSA